MSRYLWVQFGLVTAGASIALFNSEVSGVAWAVVAGIWIWRHDRERQRADLEATKNAILVKILAMHGVHVKIEERKE